MIGIYAIINKLNDKIYIGSSNNIKGRLNKHKNDLNSNAHHNKHLQRAWIKYGKENFIFLIIEEIENEVDLLEREQYYLDYYESYNYAFGYNIHEIAGSPLGYKHTEEVKRKMSEIQKEMKNKKHKRKHRIKIAETLKNKYKNGLVNGMKDKKHSEETRKLISKKVSEKLKGEKNPRNTMNLEKALLIKQKLLEETNEKWLDKYDRISKELNISKRMVQRIKSGEHYLSKEIGGNYNEW